MTIRLSDGCHVYVEKHGTGSPTLFLHGGPGYWSGSFQKIAGASLEKHRTMIYADQRGCGRSDHTGRETYTLERLLLDIEEIRTYYKLEKLDLLAHLFGGILATAYAYRFPKRVNRLLLRCTTLHMRASFIHQIETVCKLGWASGPSYDGRGQYNYSQPQAWAPGPNLTPAPPEYHNTLRFNDSGITAKKIRVHPLNVNNASKIVTREKAAAFLWFIITSK